MNVVDQAHAAFCADNVVPIREPEKPCPSKPQSRADGLCARDSNPSLHPRQFDFHIMLRYTVDVSVALLWRGRE